VSLDALALEGEGTGRPTERPAHQTLKGVTPWYPTVSEPVSLTGEFAVDINAQYAIVEQNVFGWPRQTVRGVIPFQGRSFRVDSDNALTLFSVR
jgi:hypothetical protein